MLVTTKIDVADWHTSTRESLKPGTDSAEEIEEASHQGEQRAAWMADTNCMVWSVSLIFQRALAMLELLPALEGLHCVPQSLPASTYNHVATR